MKGIQNPLVPGQIVKSKSGRDKGDVFFVVGVIDDDYVLIADGDRRKSEKSQRKNGHRAAAQYHNFNRKAGEEAE